MKTSNPLLPHRMGADGRKAIFYVLVFIGIFFGNLNTLRAGTICASVQLQLDQQLTFERQGFNATMTITNGLATSDLTNVSVSIYFTDAKGNPVSGTTDPNATGPLFFYEVAPGTTLATSVPGGQTTSLKWLIIPAPGAAGITPQGTQYYVGATLTYQVAGQPQTVTVTPNYIYVQPQPLLTLDYFLPDQVYGRDPTSSIITPPIPFNLGVRVKNTGYGTASNLQINSGQPQITNNPQNLAVQFVLVGASVNDAPVQPTLLANFGTINAQQASVARWEMTSSLSGRFSFTASFTHADSLGGAVTSLLTATNAHSLVQDVLVDLPGRDNVRDFLAKDGSALTVYESQGIDTSVSDVSSSTTLNPTSGQSYQLRVPANPGFIYAQVPDPYQGTLIVRSAVRGDGKQMNLDNVWLSRQLHHCFWRGSASARFWTAGRSNYCGGPSVKPSGQCHRSRWFHSDFKHGGFTQRGNVYSRFGQRNFYLDADQRAGRQLPRYVFSG